MRHLRVPRSWYLPLGLVAFTGIVLLAGCSGPYPQSTLNPRGDFAHLVDAVFMKTVYLAAIIFVLVEGGLLWAIFKFRGKPDDADPRQVHGHTVIEILWTIIPAIVLAIVAVPTVRGIFATSRLPATSADGQPPLKVEVVGHQWFWEFRYPDLGITTASELHVPVNRVIDLHMKSADVIHSFWVPQFAGKRDVFPNRETRLWFSAEVTGSFPGACTEFCGEEHGRMDYHIVVDSAPAFEAYIARRLADSAINFNGRPMKPQPVADTVAQPAVDSEVVRGQALFLSKGCSGCHSVSSVHALVTIGPNLSGIGSRGMIASGWLPNTDANLRKWIEHTQQVKPGVLMKVPFPVNDDEANALIAYLHTLR